MEVIVLEAVLYGAHERVMGVTIKMTGKKNSRTVLHPGELHLGDGFVWARAEHIEAVAQALASASDGLLAQAMCAIAERPPACPPRRAPNEERHQANSAKKQRARLTFERQLQGILSEVVALSGSADDAIATHRAMRDGWRRPVDWPSLPPACDPASVEGGRLCAEEAANTGGDVVLLERRARRKRAQVEAIGALVIAVMEQRRRAAARLDGWRPVVLDAGCGGGNLSLPLAAMAPWADIVACDFNEVAVQHVLRRAADAGLPNVRGCVARLEECKERCDVVVALHCCGRATDHAMQIAVDNGAVLVAAPCCIGKLRLNNSVIDCSPRSRWLGECISAGAFSKVARAADWSDALAGGATQRRCKLLVEQDRTAWAREQGFDAVLIRLTGEEGYSKDDCIVAAPREEELDALLADL